MTILVLLLHLLIDLQFGIFILSLIGVKRIDVPGIATSIATGVFCETMLIAILNFSGVSIFSGFVLFTMISVLGFIWSYWRLGLQFNCVLSFPRLSIYEWLLSAIILEEILWSLIILVRMPIYFDDALNHWSGRGRALLHEQNWSWDSDSFLFLGDPFGHIEYPLLASIWRSVNHAILNDTTSLTERSDGFIFWLILCVIIFNWIREWTDKRWLALTGVTMITLLPLETWHITAGYADIIIQTYFLLTLYTISKGQYIISGLFTAAMIWTKNEGLIIYMPVAMSYLIVELWLTRNHTLNPKVVAFMKYCLTCMVLSGPWVLFKLIYQVGFTIPSKEGLAYIPGSFVKFLEALFNAPSSNLFWTGSVLIMIVYLKRAFKSRKLRGLYMTGLLLLVFMAFVFTSTGAYIFLKNQMTIHRSLLQIAPVFIVIVITLPFIKKDIQSG